MNEPRTRLALFTPPVADDRLLAALEAACAAGDVAAVVLRLAPADDRSLTDLVRRYASAVQEREAALVIACVDSRAELVTIATRGGADGVHATIGSPASLRGLSGLRAGLPKGRILGAGPLGSRDDAMAAGEAGLDYLAFGEADAQGRRASLEEIVERATWWAEIFETPCIAVAGTAEELGPLARTGAEFLGLESDLWSGPQGAAAVAAAQEHLLGAESAR